MKCALVIPAWVPEDIFSNKTAGSQINYWQPIGTLYVASCLLEAGHEVRFINGAFTPHSEIIEELRSWSPDFVGLYSTTFGWDRAVRTAEDIKFIDPGIFICVGGPYPVAVRGKCLESSSAIDAVVTGEGERTTVELLERLSSGRGLDGVPGTVYRDRDRIVENPLRPLIEDLDDIPFPARHLLGEPNSYIPPPATYKRRPVSVMITSRGCNRRCLYCFQLDKTRKSGIRFRGVENVIAEIEHCIKLGYREIKFLDDTLAADYGRATEICEEIIRRKLDFTWFASACVNQVDAPLMRKFREAGCWAVLFGAESGVQKNLNTIRKGIRPEQTMKAVKAAKDAGIKVSTPFLFGIPGETFEEGLQTIDFACRLDPDIANFHAITPFPGTELYDNIEKYGTMSPELSDYTYQGMAFTPHTMSREDIARLRQIAFRRFYSRPRFLLRRVLELRSRDDLKAAFIGLRSLLNLWATKDVFVRRNRA